MQTEGSVAPPQLSPDGQWWWDGAAWVPAPAAELAPVDPVDPVDEVVPPVEAPAEHLLAADLMQHAHDPSLPSDSFASLAAAPIPRQSSPFAEFTAPPVLDLPAVAAPYQAPAYQAAVYQPVPVRSVDSPGRTLGLASLVCSLTGLGLPAVVLGHVSRSRDRTAGMPPNGLALAGLIIGYVGMALVLVGLIAAIAVPTFLAQRVKAQNATVVSQLSQAASAQGTTKTNTGRYALSVQELVEVGFSPDPAIPLDVLTATSSSFCLRASMPSRGGTPMYADSTGTVSTTPCG